MIHKISKKSRFDFDCRKLIPKPLYGSMCDPQSTQEENKKITLLGLQNFCINCRLCPVGCELIEYEDEKYDPHVLSNMMFNAKFMVVGQGPSITECKSCVPFLGEAGNNFDKELTKNKIDRTKFYITNIVKCFTKNIDEEKKTCAAAFLANEIKIIKPKLIITLGEFAFKFFCPEEHFLDKLGKITKSRFGKVYSIHYPNNPNYQETFSRQIELLAKLIKKIS